MEQCNASLSALPSPVAPGIVMPRFTRDCVVIQDVLSVVEARVTVHYSSRCYLQLEKSNRGREDLSLVDIRNIAIRIVSLLHPSLQYKLVPLYSVFLLSPRPAHSSFAHSGDDISC